MKQPYTNINEQVQHDENRFNNFFRGKTRKERENYRRSSFTDPESFDPWDYYFQQQNRQAESFWEAAMQAEFGDRFFDEEEDYRNYYESHRNFNDFVFNNEDSWNFNPYQHHDPYSTKNEFGWNEYKTFYEQQFNQNINDEYFKKREKNKSKSRSKQNQGKSNKKNREYDETSHINHRSYWERNYSHSSDFSSPFADASHHWADEFYSEENMSKWNKWTEETTEEMNKKSKQHKKKNKKKKKKPKETDRLSEFYAKLDLHGFTEMEIDGKLIRISINRYGDLEMTEIKKTN